MGLRRIIRKRLSAQSFNYLTDLASAATRVEELMKRIEEKFS